MKIITRIRGGLGNQLFCYAAARRLALAHGAELALDDVTGFARDARYRRRYALDSFSIPARKATPSERLEPFERARRAVMKFLSSRKPFAERRYVQQEFLDFDPRVLALEPTDLRYMDGLWQSEGYFEDVEETIRQDLRMTAPGDPGNRTMADAIREVNAVAVHLRWFEDTGSARAGEVYNLSPAYYDRAIAHMDEAVASPHYFVFSDDPDRAAGSLHLPGRRATFVSHNRHSSSGAGDLWLMRQCRHFIIANSTFSWWGAWLGEPRGKIVIAPDFKVDGMTAWGFKGLLPSRWLTL